MKIKMLRLHSALSALLITLVACAQSPMGNELTIKGKASAGAEQIVVYDLETMKPIDTIKVVGNEFVYSVANPEKEKMLGLVDAKLRQQVAVVTDGNGAEVDMSTGIAKGTPLNDRMAALTTSLLALNDKYRKIEAGYHEETDSAVRADLRKRMAGFEREVMDTMYAFIDRNQDNILPAYVMMTTAQGMDYDKLAKYVASGAKYTKSAMFAPVKQYVDYMRPSMEWVGKRFVDVRGNDLGGKAHKLSEYVGKGNYVLVDFWASWCGPCMKEMPAVKGCWQKYRSKGFEVVGISLDNDAAKWRAAVDGGGYDWKHISDLGGWKSAAASTYGVQSIPWNFLCDGTGKIVAVSLRGEQLSRKLAEIYGE